MSATLATGAVWGSRHNEARRRFVVRAVFFVYLLSLLEGPFRKWYLPALADPLTLLRDPFVIALYAYCLLNGLILMRGMATLWLGFAALTTCFGTLQHVVSGFGLTGWMLGVRTYWLYMPLAFVVAAAFRREDVMRFLRLNLWIALPYAVLVASQYNAGPGAFINRGVGGDEMGAVGLGGGILRPFGLFTYTGPNVQFTAAMVAMFTAVFLSGPRERPAWPIFLAMAAAVGAMTVLTGSRGIYFQAGIILGLTMLGLLLGRPSSRNLWRSLGILAFVVLAGVLFVKVFPDMLTAMQGRFQRAAASEGSIWMRAFSGLIEPLEAFSTAPVSGHGIGAGAPGVVRVIGLPPLIYGESDLQRNMNELGLLLGSAMLLLRLGTSAWIFLLALRLARRGHAAGWPLAGFVLPMILMGQITHSPLTAFPVYLVMGLILAMTRASR